MKGSFLRPFSYFFIILFLLSTFSASAQESEEIKVTHGPYLQRMTDQSVSLVWTTNKNSVGWVELAADDSTNFYHEKREQHFDVKDGLKNISTIHRVDLSNLRPGTKYRYRIFSQEVLSHQGIQLRYGQVVATQVFRKTPPSFRTNDYKKENVSFLTINDIHERNEMLKTLLKGTDWEQTDFVLFNGDMVNSSRSEDQIFSGFMDTSVVLFARETPMYYARGNHETRGPFASSFSQYFSGPNDRLYYIFRQGPAAVIVLDSGEDKPDNDIEYGGITDFDQYRSEQEAWLKTAIEDPLFKEAPFKLAVAHIPPLRGWHGEVEVADKFAKLLDQAGIDLMICAHYHRFVRKEAGESGFNFPIIVNSNHAVVQTTIDQRMLDLKIIDADGSIVDTLKIEK